MKLELKIYNPGGNITALVKGYRYTNKQKKIINNMIKEKYPQVEQVGFLSDKEKYLEMAGGEFCINATRCAVYEYSKKLKDKKEIEISTSGTDKRIKGKIINKNEIEI